MWMNCPQARWIQRVTTYGKRSFMRFQRRSTSTVSARTTTSPSRRGSIKPTTSTAKNNPIPKSVHTQAAASIDPYNYTSGRWLRRDRVELESRYIKFDFHLLCDRVLELCPGASSITSCVKKEGNYNRVFIFTCNTSQRVVARLPTSVSGPAKFTTNSEVATISYIQANTSVPIPKILDWNDNASNPIGSEYIIMEEATGTQLAQAWPDMAGEQQISCIRSIYTYIRQVAQLEFPAYGSLYFSSLPLDCTYEIPSAPEFRVGPHCGAMFWDCNAIEPRYYHSVMANRGPWPTLTDFCDSLINSGISRLPLHNDSYRKRPKFHGSIADHLRLLEYSRDVLKKIAEDPRIQKAAPPTLFHFDLNMRNIFVSEHDPTIVTGFIDWQSSSIEPAFMHADVVPDFAMPSNFDTLENGNPVSTTALCQQAFDACVHGLVPRLSAARLLDRDLLRPFWYCHRTWKDSATAFKQELIEISRRWEELGLAGSCPYPLPNSEELEQQKHNYKTLETAQMLKSRLMEHLNVPSDGWVPTELWEQTKAAHAEIFKEVSRAILENQESENEQLSHEELLAIWPFDIGEQDERSHSKTVEK